MPSAEPVKVSAGTVPELPENVGVLFVPDGVMDVVTVPIGVKLTVPFVPVAVTVWVCVPIALPVKVGAEFVPAGVNELPGETPPILLKAPELVPAKLPDVVVIADPVNVGAEFVPAGVPALVAPLVTWLPVNVSAGTVPAVPVNVDAAT